jgi:hypothetical protein
MRDESTALFYSLLSQLVVGGSMANDALPRICRTTDHRCEGEGIRHARFRTTRTRQGKSLASGQAPRGASGAGEHGRVFVVSLSVSG